MAIAPRSKRVVTARWSGFEPSALRHGTVPEWLNGLAWKASVGEKPACVRITPVPPLNYSHPAQGSYSSGLRGLSAKELAR